MASYKFTLRHPDGVDIFGTEYVSNWADISTSLTEHDVYKGVLREFSNTFEFNGYIRNRIVSMLDIYGYDVAIYLTIEKGNDNKEQWSFVQWSDELKADIQSIDIDELYCKLDFADNEFTAKLMARHDTKVNLDVTESIDGDNIRGLAYSDIKLHDRKLILNTKLEYLDKTDTLDAAQITGSGLSIFSIPLEIKYKSDNNFKYTPFACSDAIDDSASAFYLRSEKTRSLDLQISSKIKLSFALIPIAVYWRLDLVRIKRNDETGTAVTEIIQTFDKSVGFGGDKPNLGVEGPLFFDVTYNGVINIGIGESLQFGLFVSTASPILLAMAETVKSEIICASIDSHPETQSKCLRPHEGFSRLVKILTGATGFYSEFFGR